MRSVSPLRAVGRRGLAVSCQPASQQIAASAGALVGVVLSEVMTSEALDSYGWRIAFLIGAITLPFGLWMRTRLPETLHGRETGHVVTDLAFATTVVSNSVGIVAALYGGWLADRAGRWPVMVWPRS